MSHHDPERARKSSAWVIGLLAFVVGGCSGNEWEPIAQPILPQGSVTLRVVYAHNPRFEHLDATDIETLLAETKRMTLRHLGVDLTFGPVTEVTLPTLFKEIPTVVIEKRRPSIFDFKEGTGDQTKLRAGIASTVNSHPVSVDSLAQFSQPYLLRPLRELSRPALAEALSDTMIARLGLWSDVKAGDGKSIINSDPYNEWIYWDTLGYGDLQFDLVITNQMIVSAEYDSGDIHTALRGGLTVGTTTFSRHGRFNSYVFWSTFPFTSNSDLATELRGGHRYNREEALRLAGAYLTHEIGHLLFRYGHPFGADACVMNPVAALRFNDWNEKLDQTNCAPNSRPEMTAGVAKLYLNRAWLNMNR